MKKKTTLLYEEREGEIVEVPVNDQAQFEAVNGVAAYNAAAGNPQPESFWAKLFRYSSKASEVIAEHAAQGSQTLPPVLLSDQSAADASGALQSIRDMQPDGWDGDTPIYAGVGWAE